MGENFRMFLKDFATLDIELFKKLLIDIMEGYEKNIIRFFLSGPRMSVEMDATFKEMLVLKHNIDDYNFNLCIRGLTNGFHQIIENEIEMSEEILKEYNDEKIIDGYRDKINLVNNYLEKYPDIKQGFLSYTHSVTNFFNGVNWDVSLKFGHSKGTRYDLSEPYVDILFRVITDEFTTSEIDLKSKSIEFTISKKDIDFLISNLNKIKERVTYIESKIEDEKFYDDDKNKS